MSTQARITSVEAIELFRSQLVVYLSQMRPALDEITGEVLRTRAWMDDDRRRHWQQEMKKKGRKLDDAKQEMFTATMSQFGDAGSLQRMMVQKAQREMQAVEEKMVVLKKWGRDMDNKTSPLVKQMEQLHGFLTVEMEKAVAYLDQVLSALEAYQNISPHSVSRPEDPK